MLDFLKKIIPGKKKEDALNTEEVQMLQQNKGSVAQMLHQARKNPRLMKAIEEVTHRMTKDGVDLNNKDQVQAWVNKNKEELTAQQQAPKGKTVVHEGPRAGRNDPCPCGSGKKYKKCCAAK